LRELLSNFNLTINDIALLNDLDHTGLIKRRIDITKKGINYIKENSK